MKALVEQSSIRKSFVSLSQFAKQHPLLLLASAVTTVMIAIFFHFVRSSSEGEKSLPADPVEIEYQLQKKRRLELQMKADIGEKEAAFEYAMIC